MNRLQRSRSAGSASILESCDDFDKYKKPQPRKPGARLSSGTWSGPLLVVLLIGSAFLAAHNLTNFLPAAETHLPDLDVPRKFARATLPGEQPAALAKGTAAGAAGAAGAAAGVAGSTADSHSLCTGSLCQHVMNGVGILGRGSSGQQGLDSSSGRGSNSKAALEADTEALEAQVASIQQLFDSRHTGSAGGVQGGVAGAATERHLRRQQEQPAVLEEQEPQQQQQERQLLPGGGLAVPKRKRSKRRSRYTPSLKQDIDDLIQEATEVAKLKGIPTDADAVEGEDEGSADSSVQAGAEALLKAVEPCNSTSCQPHGTCIQGRCHCTVLYTGKRCGHGLLLTRPYLPDAMRHFTAGFEGELVLHRGTQHRELKVYRPPVPGEEAGGQQGGAGAFSVVADADRLRELLPLLPERDTVLRGAAYSSCAVVGSSGSLLLHRAGPQIDGHEAVFRFNAAPTAGYEPHAGSRTTHRVTNLASWGFREGPGEAVLVHASLPQAVEGLAWNGRQPQPQRLFSLDPDFEAYMTRSFSFAPSQGLFGVVLALQTCRRVTLYGFGLSRAQGVLQRYWDPCDELSNPQRAEQQWTAVRALAEAGLVQLGEPCTLECMSGTARCTQCRQAAGITPPEPPACDAAARQRREQRRQQHAVPWAQQQQQDAAGSGESGDAEQQQQQGAEQQQQQEQEQQAVGSHSNGGAEQQQEQERGGIGVGNGGQQGGVADTTGGDLVAREGLAASLGGEGSAVAAGTVASAGDPAQGGAQAAASQPGA
ncbi:hypothetical protein N2152v2_006951 [Parachlorella kessleri]